MAELIVYTAIAGEYDLLRPPPASWIGQARFVAYVDRPQDANGWELRSCRRRWSDPCRNAKEYKLLPHECFPDAPLTLWIDGAVTIQADTTPADFLAPYLENPALAVFPHRTRKCLYVEGDTCIAKHKDDPRIITRQLAGYRAESYPAMNGLAECCVLLRQNNAETRRLCDAWYDEVLAGSRRDQLSFNYVAWKLGYRYQSVAGNIDRNRYFRRLPHLWMESLRRHSPGKSVAENLLGTEDGMAIEARARE